MSHVPAAEKIEFAWLFDRQTETKQIDQYLKRPDYRLLCYDVLDSVYAIRDTQQILPAHIEAFAAATTCPYEWVFCYGGKRLVQMAHHSALAVDKLRELASHPELQPRFNVMCLMDYRPPVELALELISNGLQDRSAKVARRAAQACFDVDDPKALTLLQQRLPVETRSKVWETIDFTIALIQTPPVREGRQETRTVRGAVIVRTVDPPKSQSKQK